jgi:DNA polymerase-4
VIVRPRFDAYVAASKSIRAMMEALTPQIEPLSLDEAFLDLAGTRRLHGVPPAVLLARLVRRMETELGLSGSIGLSHNKFLAKVASDLDKPRGFSVIGRAETLAFLETRSVRLIWGVGDAGQQALDAAGIHTFADLWRWDRKDLIRRFGTTGDRLWRLSRGEDGRRVDPHDMPKSISSETTFDTDITDRDLLDGHIWRLAERTADRAKAKGLGGETVTLKLKRADFSALTRRETLRQPTQLADRIYRAAAELMSGVRDNGPFRLVGVGISGLSAEARADQTEDLLDPGAARRAGAERAADAIRRKFGTHAIVKGRALR